MNRPLKSSIGIHHSSIACLPTRQVEGAESTKLDGVIRQNLKGLGFGK